MRRDDDRAGSRPLPMSPAHELYTLIEAMRDAARAGQPAALATLTATRGAAFRRAGTRMLVRADGRVVCELSGGCPQRDIVERARRVIENGRPELARYNADLGLDVLMEMGCGGELDVLIEPLASTRVGAFFDALMGCLETRRSAVVATLFARDGEVAPPRRALWCNDELRFDDLGDAGLRDAVARVAGPGPAPRARTVRLPSTDGVADVLIEHLEPPHALFAVGSHATARALLAVACALGWQVTLVDRDPARLHAAALRPGTRAVQATPQTLHESLALDACSSVVLMTHNLAQDLEWLRALHNAPVAYVGAICSRERAQRMLQDGPLPRAGLHAPAGLDIGSDTPAEIALAIAAEIIAVLNGRRGMSLRDSDGALHA